MRKLYSLPPLDYESEILEARYERHRRRIVSLTWTFILIALGGLWSMIFNWMRSL